MSKTKKRHADAPKKRGKSLLAALLTLSAALTAVLAAQVYLVYRQGALADESAALLLSAFSDRASASPAAATAPPSGAPGKTPGPEDADAADTMESPEPAAEPVIPPVDAAAAEGADEHRLIDGSAAIDETAVYVQPDAPEIEARDAIIQRVVAAVGEDGVIGVLSIPELDVELPVIGKWSYDLLKLSVCRYRGPDANGVGNLVVLGHNYKSGAHFGKLDRLKVGSELFLTDTNSRKLRYVVYEIETVEPTAFSELEQYRGGRGLTLVTCVNSGTQRQVFRCEQVDG